MEDIIETRLTALEQWRIRIDIERAKESVDRIHIDKRFDALETQLREIKATAKQLTYFVASAIIVYVVTFVLNGGLSIIKPVAG